MKDNADMPVFPSSGDMSFNDNEDGKFAAFNLDGGLTKREYFAAMAMNGFISNNKINDVVNHMSAVNENIAEWSYQIADAMLAQSEKASDEK